MSAMRLASALLLLCPVACRGLAASGPTDSEGDRPGHGRLHKLTALAQVRGDGCRAWCRLSRKPWEKKCRWAGCGGGCWDCQRNEKANAFNYELVQGRQQLMLAETKKAELLLSQEEERSKVEKEENLELAEKRMELVRQRQKELEEEERHRAVEVPPTFSQLPANFNSSMFAMAASASAAPSLDLHEYSTELSLEPDIQLLDDA